MEETAVIVALLRAFPLPKSNMKVENNEPRSLNPCSALFSWILKSHQALALHF